MIIVYQNLLNSANDPDLIKEIEAIKMRPCPHWLGNFVFWWKRGLELPKYPLISKQIEILSNLQYHVEFNAIFIQKYLPGQNVFRHKDPKSNLDCTVIGLYGDFDQTILKIEDQEYSQSPGDVFVLPTTVNGKTGPAHEMYWTENQKGTRYAIILAKLQE